MASARAGLSSIVLPDSHRTEAEEGLAFEGSIKSMPRLARSRPSDRAARRKVLEGRLRDAQAKAAKEVASPLTHGRCCLAGLIFVELIRTAAWWQGTIPGWSVFGMHFLTTSSDLACILCAVPLFSIGIRGQCVQLGCLGPMLTLVFAMCLVDLSALGAYLVVATPRPLSPGARSFLDALEAVIGVWEFALLASVAFQLALCSSSWRVYKELRVIGLYPPGSDPASVGELRHVSVLEVMCEAEDVELLADCEVNCENMSSPLLACPAGSGGGSAGHGPDMVAQVPATAPTEPPPAAAGRAEQQQLRDGGNQASTARLGPAGEKAGKAAPGEEEDLCPSVSALSSELSSAGQDDCAGAGAAGGGRAATRGGAPVALPEGSGRADGGDRHRGRAA